MKTLLHKLGIHWNSLHYTRNGINYYECAICGKTTIKIIKDIKVNWNLLDVYILLRMPLSEEMKEYGNGIYCMVRLCKLAGYTDREIATKVNEIIEKIQLTKSQGYIN